MTRGLGGSSANREPAGIAPVRDGVAAIGVTERPARIAAAQGRMREAGVMALCLDASGELDDFTACAMARPSE